VVDCQTIDGSWQQAGVLLGLVGKAEADLAEVRAANRVRCQARRASWRLVEQKALDWLVHAIGTLPEVETLIGLAVAVL
jgi:hypothetical protein